MSRLRSCTFPSLLPGTMTEYSECLFLNKSLCHTFPPETEFESVQTSKI